MQKTLLKMASSMSSALQSRGKNEASFHVFEQIVGDVAITKIVDYTTQQLIIKKKKGLLFPNFVSSWEQVF